MTIEHLVLPIEQALDSVFAGGCDPSVGAFLRARLAKGDPGPVHVIDGEVTTSLYDAEQAHPWNLEWVQRYGT